VIGLNRKPQYLIALAAITLLLALLSSVLPVAAASPQPVCFEVVAGLFSATGTWSASGLINSSGTATFAPFVAGVDPHLGIPATVHDRFVLTDEQGTITFQGQGKSALVTNNAGNTVAGYQVTWVVIAGTGAYSNLRAQGDGHAWLDFASGTFPVYQCGQGHFDPGQ
jgi:hypothetical protein